VAAEEVRTSSCQSQQIEELNKLWEIFKREISAVVKAMELGTTQAIEGVICRRYEAEL